MLDRQLLQDIRDGRAAPPDLASLVVPHYQTGELAKLCLRAIRRMTDSPYEVIVVDNYSRDGSLDYLRSIPWIRLIERGPETEPDAVHSHASAVQLGLAAARGQWLVSLHTDTLARRDGWLRLLVDRLKAHPRAAALGSDKIDHDPAWYRAMKKLGDKRRLAAFFRRLAGRKADPKAQDAAWYPRSFCALFRMDLIRQMNLAWRVDGEHPAGDLLYRDLVAAGYEGIQLSGDEMSESVDHIAHATALLAKGGLHHWRGNHKVRRALARVMGSDLAKDLLSDDSLDR
jgi:glycosyltransferase involved in cell wall biosynthesis